MKFDKNTLLGFAGLGFVGGNLADNFDERGYKNQVRYSLDYNRIDGARDLKKCDVVFVAVPTPTNNGKVDLKALTSVLELVSKEAVVVIKSTVPVCAVRDLVDAGIAPKKTVYCPEFLDVSTAREDTDKPVRNVIGVADKGDQLWKTLANDLLEILPKAKHKTICSWEEAAFIKYGGNAFFMAKNFFFNALHDMVVAEGCDYEVVRKAVAADPRIGKVHTFAVDKGGRGAGGACLPKDFSAFREQLERNLPIFDPAVSAMYHIERRNRKLLNDSGKDADIVKSVFSH